MLCCHTVLEQWRMAYNKSEKITRETLAGWRMLGMDAWVENAPFAFIELIPRDSEDRMFMGCSWDVHGMSGHRGNLMHARFGL